MVNPDKITPVPNSQFPSTNGVSPAFASSAQPRINGALNRGNTSHAPAHPSGLRTARAPDDVSPEDRMRGSRNNSMANDGEHGRGRIGEEQQETSGEQRQDRNGGYSGTTSSHDFASGNNSRSPTKGSPASPHDTSRGASPEPTENTGLLARTSWGNSPANDSDASNSSGPQNRHKKRPWNFLRSYGSFASYASYRGPAPYDNPEAFGGRHPQDIGIANHEHPDAFHAVLGDSVADGLLNGAGGSSNRVSTTRWLAWKSGIKSERMMYLFYYVPFLNWIRQYQAQYIVGDLVAALTMASFYIPMALSYASNLGHVPPVQGLYAFVFNPLIYAILGTCPQMVVGPEAAGSLLTGQVVSENIKKGKVDVGDQTLNAQIAGTTTFMAGCVIFFAGVFRLGFLDNVLSRPFLRGFISAIGIVIFIDQLIPELGLDDLAKEMSITHGSTIDKAVFICQNLGKSHGLTAAVSLTAFFIILVLRELKKRLQPRYPSIAYIPDRFLVVVLSAVLTWKYSWDTQGLDILGDIRARGRPFPIHFPFHTVSHLKYASDAFSTSFAIALLGFFESSVAAKSLGTGEKKGGGGNVLKNINLSANRELVALGVANIFGGLFMSLPAFGGYGRSKVNASTGGKTPMSSIFLSLISIICILFLLPYFYYIPKGVLSAMISIVAYSLLEEIPHDLFFFLKIRDTSSLLLMALIFFATIFWNLKIGIAVGIGLSLLRVIRHSTRPRIQILGRVPGTTDRFENAEAVVAEHGGGLEFLKGVLIVKIPEPLTFANTGDLKNRLRRLEDHGTGQAHPALPPVRSKHANQNVLFDIHGVTSLDGAGAQVLLEIVQGYVDRGMQVYWCRVPREGSKVWNLLERSGIMDACGGRSHFVGDVVTALKLSEQRRESVEMGA